MTDSSAHLNTRLLYLDLVGGAAGDMLLSALLDAGASLERVRSAVASLGLEGVQLETEEVHPAGLRAFRVNVLVRGVLGDSDHAEGTPHFVHPAEHEAHGHHGHRSYSEIRRLLDAAPLDERVRAFALDAFRHLASAEARVHGVDVDAVVLHEVGADDALADIVGVASALAELSPDEVVCSPVPMGRGLTRGAHGPIPLPGPAVLELLRGVPLVETPLSGETITPTGAALIRAMNARFGPIPTMTLECVGVGAGHKTWPDRPNIVRAFWGRAHTAPTWNSSEESVVESNIDDMTPQHLAALERALFDAGATDVWSHSVKMKKDRVGTIVSALVRDSARDGVVEAFFRHSTTLGVRTVRVERTRAERTIEVVETTFGRVRVKVAGRSVGPPLAMPEYDDCARLAAEAGVSVREVHEAALLSMWRHQGR